MANTSTADLRRLIYISSAKGSFGQAELDQILLSAREQ